MVQIDSKLYTVCLSYSIDMRQMNHCEKGKMFYTRYVVYKIYENYMRLRPCMCYMKNNMRVYTHDLRCPIYEIYIIDSQH